MCVVRIAPTREDLQPWSFFLLNHIPNKNLCFEFRTPSTFYIYSNLYVSLFVYVINDHGFIFISS